MTVSSVAKSRSGNDAMWEVGIGPMKTGSPILGQRGTGDGLRGEIPTPRVEDGGREIVLHVGLDGASDKTVRIRSGSNEWLLSST
jgi:hypothetical protein